MQTVGQCFTGNPTDSHSVRLQASPSSLQPAPQRRHRQLCCPEGGRSPHDKSEAEAASPRQSSAHHSLGSLKRSYSGSMRSCRLRLREVAAGEHACMVGWVQRVQSAAAPMGAQYTFNMACCH